MRCPTSLLLRRGHLKTLALVCVTATWWGCAEPVDPDGDTTTGTGGNGATGGDGAGASGGAFQDGGGGAGDGGGAVCVSVSEHAESTPLDIVFLLDWSQSMQGESWEGTTSALQTFLLDPLSAGISAGMVYLPTIKPFESPCDINLFKVLDVPIAPLPGNSFALTNSMPEVAIGSPTPLWAALGGALMAATAHQDANPDHKVILVMTGDGGYNTCGPDINDIAAWAKSARDYNGVKTYVITVQSTSYNIENLEKIATAGGTTLYDASDIDQFSEVIADIRSSALGCDYTIPDPPPGETLEPDQVNFTYTPGGEDMPITIPRADDLADCGDAPGWYYDDNHNPTKILICPASCTTISNDADAEVAVAFGCDSVPN